MTLFLRVFPFAPALSRTVCGALLGLAAFGAVAAPAAMSSQEARHLLLRSGFAPTEAQVAAITGLPAARVVDELIARARSAEPRHAAPAFATAPPPALPGPRTTLEEQRAWRAERAREGGEIKAWWLREMWVTPTPLRERMVLFWHSHFATGRQKVALSQAMWNQHMLLRSEALGNFGTLLHGIARDPAMLLYLDAANSRKEAPNENFAREVMELFSLGEASKGGGYTETDIKEMARALTGLGVDRATSGFRFRPAFHDTGSKTLFGQNGSFDGDGAIALILQQPAVARFITAKLWKEFVSPEPQPGEAGRIAQKFHASGYDIGVAVRELLLSDAFWAPEQRGSLVKSPLELVVGSLRQFQVPVSEDTMPYVNKAAQLGQNLLMPPNVKGWPGYTEWINATSLLQRKAFAAQLFRANGIGIDADGFLGAYGGHSDREPDAATQVRLAQALLPVPPTQPVPAGTVGVLWLRALAMDSAYQLK